MGAQYDLFASMSKDAKPGMRLQRVELLNWGTFNKLIWPFEMNGENTLITGQSGSGKSSLIDAIQTLLIDGRRFNYNQAAGSGPRERTLHTYVMGCYGKRLDENGRLVTDNLRDTNKYSIILAVFKDMMINRTVTMAMLMFYRGQTASDLCKNYIVAEQDLSIKKDFEIFKGNIRVLKSEFKKKGILVTEKYSEYHETFSRLLGGLDEQALNIFQQAIYMKKIDSLTDFIRNYILEPNDDINKDIDHLIAHFQDLNIAYEKTVEAKNQVEELKPISKAGDTLNNIVEAMDKMDVAQRVTSLWASRYKKDFYEKEIEQLTEEKEKLAKEYKEKTALEERVSEDIDKLTLSIGKSGGDAIERVTGELKQARRRVGEIENECLKYKEKAVKIGLGLPKTSEEFNKNKIELNGIKDGIEKERSENREKLTEIEIKLNENTQKEKEIENEIESLKRRTNNIPDKLIRIQKEICKTFGLTSDEIPFVGELLEVKDLPWEGAIERLFHGFALSLLVPKHLYLDVVTYINTHHLKGKLVYYYVDNNKEVDAGELVDDDSVINKIEIKQGTIFENWLYSELKRRFNYRCCDTIEKFKNCKKGITIEGQIKSNDRHEKDDRRSISDRTFYCLGFSNEKKISILTDELGEVRKVISDFNSQRKSCIDADNSMEDKLYAVRVLEGFEEFSNLDLLYAEKRIKELETEIEKLNKNDKLKTLRETLAKKKNERDKLNEAIRDLSEKMGATKGKLEKDIEALEENIVTIAEGEKINDFQSGLEYIEEIYREQIKSKITLKSIDTIKGNIIRWLDKEIEFEKGNYRKVETELTKMISGFRNKYSLNTIDGTVASLPDCNRMLKELELDKIYEYEENFKNLLRSTVTVHFANIRSKFSTREKVIKGKIESINMILKNIDFNPGRYININVKSTNNSEINEFKTQLEYCIGVPTDDIKILEERFQISKELINRFKERKKESSINARWVERVIDVRNWFLFSASEIDRDTEIEVENYSDSSGKSGGQKEKLAYTILGAGLSYNYDPKFKDKYSTSFRVVIVDEAFLKSSEDAAKFGLELFKNLKFQFIIATPGNNLGVIVDYVKNVCYTKQEDRESLVINMSINKYKEKIKKGVEDA